MNEDDNRDENNKSIHKSSQQELQKLSYQPSSLILHRAFWRSAADRESPLFPEVFKDHLPVSSTILSSVPQSM